MAIYPSERPPACHAYGIQGHTLLVFRASYLLEHGLLDLDEIDGWYLEAVEVYRAAQNAKLLEGADG
jgi:hypothetical protein